MDRSKTALSQEMISLKHDLSALQRRVSALEKPILREPSDVQQVELWCDGGTKLGNPGMGYSSYETEGDIVLRDTKDFGRQMTSNEAEVMTLLWALQQLQDRYDVDKIDLTVKSDSLLIVNQVKGNWAVKAPHLRPWINTTRALLNSFYTWKLIHVSGKEMKKRIGH